MAGKKHAAKIAELQERLVDALDNLSTSRDRSPSTARASVRHESFIVAVWSLRFQIANLELLDDPTPKHRAALEYAALTASREIAEHEKRLVVARKAKIDDDEDEADEHEAAQAELAGNLLQLAGRR